MLSSKIKVLMIAAVAVFALASCAAETEALTDVEGATSASGVFDARGFDIEAVDLATSETVTLADFVDGEKPVVVWGFAPHCGTCLAEVPQFNAFAAANPDVQVIGVGQSDTLELAFQFHEISGAEFPLVYSTGGDIWREAAVGFQTMNVYSADLTQKVSQPFHFYQRDSLATALEHFSA